jgi:1-acyl-sn-glycerol-3-phosphate acyltransferase
MIKLLMFSWLYLCSILLFAISITTQTEHHAHADRIVLCGNHQGFPFFCEES